MSKSLYSKYKEDRFTARWLNTPTGHKKLRNIEKTKKKGALRESPQKKAQSCKVSLPIEVNGLPRSFASLNSSTAWLDRYKNYLKKRAASEMETMTDEEPRSKTLKLIDAKTCPGLIRPSPALKSKTAQLQTVRPHKTSIPVSESRSVPGPGQLPIVLTNLLHKQETKNIENNPPITQPESLDEHKFKIPQSVRPLSKNNVPVPESRSVPSTGELPAPLNLHQDTKSNYPNSSEALKLRMVHQQNKKNIPVSEGPSFGKLPIITSNIMLSKDAKQMEINQPLTEHNSLNAASMIPPETISFQHKLPVRIIPGKEGYGVVLNMGTSTTDAKPKLGATENSAANQCSQRRTETSVQTENVFVITEDDSKTLDLITNSGVTKEELTKWLDKRSKKKCNNKMTTDVIIDVDKDDENNNINQDILNWALFCSQNNKNSLLSEMSQLHKSNANQSSNTARPTRPGTPYPQMEQNPTEAKILLEQMASERFALTNRIDPPVITVVRNTQTEENTNVTQSDLFNREHHYNNLQQLVTMPNQQTQYDPQAVLMQNEQLKQQKLQSVHQQSYLQMQPRMQLPQTEHQQRFQFPQSEHQHRLQFQQPEHQQRSQLASQLQQHLQSQSFQLPRLQSQNQLQQSLHLQQPQMQYQSPLKLLELENQNMDQLQSSHNGEPQNELFQQQQFQPTQMPPNMQYAPAANYRNHSKPPASTAVRRLFPGDPRCKTMRYQFAASNQRARAMSAYETNMRTAQPQQPHQNYQQQYQQHYQNQY